VRHASVPVLLIAGLLAVALNTVVPAQTDNNVIKYVDSEGRFTFYYPREFGTTSPGTNNGFGQTAASIRFSAFSSGMRTEGLVLGGEVTLTRGFILVDLQALGGLYDALTLEAFPEPVRKQIVSGLTPLTPSNFCGQLGEQKHLDVQASAFAGLNSEKRAALSAADQFRNINPKVHRCDASGDLVVFDKEASFGAQSSGGRQHVYGVIRFLPLPYSSFQLVRATRDAPAAGLLAQMADVAKSLAISERRR
jgi:hypothetical protein